MGTDPPPADAAEYASIVINWLRDESTPTINAAWLDPPLTMTVTEWTLTLTLTLAKAHHGHVPHEVATPPETSKTTAL